MPFRLRESFAGQRLTSGAVVLLASCRNSGSGIANWRLKAGELGPNACVGREKISG